MRRAIGVTAAPGIAQATYDAAVAKLVTVSDWVDLTATITTACAGAAASDPDSLAGGLTVTTSTGTFDGATIDCNEFAWTTHTTTNDGHSETLNYDLGTIASLIPGYDPATHGVQLEECLVATGTLNGTTPRFGVLMAEGGTLTGGGVGAPGVLWNVASASACTPMMGMSSSSTPATAGLTVLDPASVVARAILRYTPCAFPGKGYITAARSTTATTATLAYLATGTPTTGDKLFFIVGQGSTTQGAISGLKARFRVRIFEWANLDITALDLGVQA